MVMLVTKIIVKMGSKEYKKAIWDRSLHKGSETVPVSVWKNFPVTIWHEDQSKNMKRIADNQKHNRK